MSYFAYCHTIHTGQSTVTGGHKHRIIDISQHFVYDKKDDATHRGKHKNHQQNILRATPLFYLITYNETFHTTFILIVLK